MDIMFQKTTESCIKPLSHQSGVLTAFPQRLKNCRMPRYALCKRQQRCANAVETHCNCLERHAAVFILSILKTNAAAWRFHSMLDSAFKLTKLELDHSLSFISIISCLTKINLN